MTSGAASNFICPACRSAVEEGDGGYRCVSCHQFYPILFGIPDFRLEGDRYLSLDEERAKAGRLHAFGQTHDFAALVTYYYSITDDVPDHLAATFTDYVVNAPARSRAATDALVGSEKAASLLDLGCGSGGALVAASEAFQDRTGVDIALRWLVIARKRLEEVGSNVRLVCADAEALPFADRSFSHVLAVDLLENMRSPAAAIGAAAAVLKESGRMYVSSSNCRWIGPHPATGVWAAGLLPPMARSALLKRKHGIDILRAVSFVSPGSVRRMARVVGLRQIDAAPLDFDERQISHRSIVFKAVARTYSKLTRMPFVRSVLLGAGPMFWILFTKEKAT